MRDYSHPTSELFDRPSFDTHRRVYHVTPDVLVPAIMKHGILPQFANGGLKVSYWVEKQALLWAIAHVSAMKAISVDQLAIFSASIWRGLLAQTKCQYVYTCRFEVFTQKIHPAIDALGWFFPDGSFANG